MVAMVGNDLKLNSGVSSVPGGVYGENFDACLECAVYVLLDTVVDDVANRVPDSGRWEYRYWSRWRRWRDLGRGSDLWILHTATEVAFTDEDGQPGNAFEWSVWWVKGVGVK